MRDQKHMKKKHILWIGLWLTALAGCSGEPYVGELPDDDSDYLEEPIPIILGLGVPSYDILTRGSGAFENTIDEGSKELWEKAQFYVYAFNKNPETDLRTSWSAGNEDACLLDGNRTLKEKNMGGKEIRVNIENTSLMPFWPDENELKVYYNTKQTSWPYNFFAYYIDDSPAILHREKDRIYFEVKVDGRRDFMSSMAELTEDQIQKLSSNPNKQKVIERSYSAYSANRGVNPVFRFKHHLSRLRFKIYPGGKGTPNAGEDEDISYGKDLIVRSIEIFSRINGEFTVAVNDPLSKDLEKPKLGLIFKEEDPQLLTLKEENGDALREEGYSVEMAEGDEDKPVYDRTSVQVGGSILIAPDTSYKILVHLEDQKNGREEDKILEYELTPPSAKMFEAGRMYTIRLAIYSLSEIEVGVEAGKWGDGGSIELNPDEEWEEHL